MGLDVADHRCLSVCLHITRKVTEFMFQEKGTKNASPLGSNSPMHNCLIDCHAEVWTRFPVLSAVQRQTISSSSKRHARTLVFVTDGARRSFASHFSDLIEAFENTTRKPTGNELSDIHVSGITFDLLAPVLAGEMEWSASCFRAGEWLVNLFCLIPIHIAVTKENRFIPLTDGVSSSDLEKDLLGAEVSHIVDRLSFGWYESLFKSYMATKVVWVSLISLRYQLILAHSRVQPVKVVSSMGEQSVGKSFALNHLVDTSFAGSAMRTTEGVWMSVTPTDSALIVALDFEGLFNFKILIDYCNHEYYLGVHSPERTAQEDTLLVLFNTAISNLVCNWSVKSKIILTSPMKVLFRNNFALSRDITGLFQSFQRSSTVLNPAANPSLFQSTLVIIIKVRGFHRSQVHAAYPSHRMFPFQTDRKSRKSMHNDLSKNSDFPLKWSLRFSLKFQSIVEREQDGNFISRLHNGKLDIIPWWARIRYKLLSSNEYVCNRPVIESKEFYKLFPTLKWRLDQQPMTHHTAGVFLDTLKTLMAKLKVSNHIFGSWTFQYLMTVLGKWLGCSLVCWQ